MSHESVKALEKAERAIELVKRTRGENSREYANAVREYQSLLGRALARVAEGPLYEGRR
jgi:hypothetical protein